MRWRRLNSIAGVSPTQRAEAPHASPSQEGRNPGARGWAAEAGGTH